MLDTDGSLVTSPKLIEKLALKTYAERLRIRPTKNELEDLKEIKERLCKLRLNSSSKNKTAPWTLEQLGNVLKNLKTNKSRDPMGYANELFHPSVAGKDLRLAIVYLMNRIKTEQSYPEALEILF
jgi:hypothetical protein